MLLFARTATRIAALAGTLLAAACGGSEAPRAGNGVDRAFVAEMVPHHRSAVDMAEVARDRSDSAFVRRLAEDIIRTQTAEISTLRREDAALERAGVEAGSLGVPDHMTGMDGDAAQLRSADPFDRAFLRMMLPHHEGAVTMAEAELQKGSDPELKALAQEIVDAQSREIRQMRSQLG